MRKRLFVLAAVIAVLMTLQSCEIPSSVEIRGSPDVSMSLNPDNAGMDDLITDNLKDTKFGDTNIKILNYTNYPGGLQAFLLHMQYTINTVGQDYEELQKNLDEIKNFKFELAPEDLDQSIVIDEEIGDINDIESMEPVEVDLSDAFNKVRNTIQTSMAAPFIFSLPIAGKGVIPEDVDPSEFDLASEPVQLEGFDSLTIGAGTLAVTIRITDFTPGPLPGSSQDGINITLGKFKIGNKEFAEEFVLNSATSHQATQPLELADTMMGDALEISIGKYTDNSTTDNAGAIVELTVTVETFPDDPAQKIEFRKISGFEIEPMDISLDSLADISLDLNLNGFVHAQIGTGSLSLNPQPESGENTLEGLNYVYDIRLMQDNVGPDIDGNYWAGISDPASPLPGPGVVPLPWVYDADNLNGLHLNGNDIVIRDGSKVTVGATNASIKLNAVPYSEKILVSFTPQIEVGSFEKIHVDIDTLVPTEDQPKIDIPSKSLEDIAEYVKSITFNRLGPKLVFGQVDIANLEMMISVPALGINPEKNYFLIEENGTNEDLVKEDYVLDIKDVGGNVKELVFDVDIRPRKINGSGEEGRVIEIRNFTTTTKKIKIEAQRTVGGEVTEKTEILCDWASAKIDPSVVKDETVGEYPEPDKKAIDLSEFSKTLHNFEFFADDIEAWLYTRGPDVLFELQPKLTLNAHYNNGSGSFKLLPDNYTFSKSEELVINPEDTDYTGPVPGGGAPISNFTEILNARPDDLRLRYSMNMGGEEDIVIKPDMFPGGDETIDLSEGIVIDMLALIPMRLKAGPDGASVEIPRAEKENPDLLGRKKPGEDTIDWIKSMNLKVTFSDSLFESAGSTPGCFYLDSSDRRIEIPITGKTMQTTISSEDLEYINGKWPYEPEMGLWFDDGTTLAFKRGTAIATVEVSADISYKFDLKNISRAAGGK